MSPLTMSMVVYRSSPPAFRAAKLRRMLVSYRHGNLRLLDPQIDQTHFPRRLQPKQLLVQFFVLHANRMHISRPFCILPTRMSEAPKKDLIAAMDQLHGRVDSGRTETLHTTRELIYVKKGAQRGTNQ